MKKIVFHPVVAFLSFLVLYSTGELFAQLQPITSSATIDFEVESTSPGQDANGPNYSTVRVSGTFTPPSGTIAGSISGSAYLTATLSTQLTFTADLNNPGTYIVDGYITNVPTGTYLGKGKVQYTDPQGVKQTINFQQYIGTP